MIQIARYLIKSRLGPKRSKTPEGYLLCLDVPIARTGFYEYAASEGMSEGVTPDENGMILSERPESVVFAVDALASFEGKPVTLDHPPENVTPADWKQYAVGHVSNVRRGTGDESDKVLADLLITDAAAIEAVESGVREVSCGYDALIEPVGPGHERISKIQGNHVALVREGRAGPGCAIKDSKGGKKDMEEKDNKLFSWEQVKEFLAFLKGGAPADKPAPVTDTDPAAATDPAPAAAGTDEQKHDDELEALKQRVAELEAERDALKAELEGNLETELIDSDDEQPATEGDENAATHGDSAAGLGFANRLEIMAPTLYAPAFASADKKADRKLKLDAMRRALDRACDDETKRKVVWAIAGRKVDSWYGESDLRVARVFNAASAAIAQINNAKVPAPVTHIDSAADSGKSYAEMVAERYAKFAKGGK